MTKTSFSALAVGNETGIISFREHKVSTFRVWWNFPDLIIFYVFTFSEMFTKKLEIRKCDHPKFDFVFILERGFGRISPLLSILLTTCFELLEKPKIHIMTQ